jgi:multicomponent Na+:H+ antiporter subunit G
MAAGAAFFVAGTIGLLRFPDLFTRLHALTKADNVGLGLIVLGLTMQSASIAAALKLMVIWLLVLLASSSASHLIARAARRNGIRPWTTG